MRARYQIDRMQLDEMGLEISLKCTLKEWREIASALDAIGSGPTWPFVGPIRRIIQKIEEDTGKSYVATQYDVLQEVAAE